MKNILLLSVLVTIITSCKKKEEPATNTTTATTSTLTIGKNYGGGVIFYLDNVGQHGLVAAGSDQSTGVEWGCDGVSIIGAQGTTVGTGDGNTMAIVAGCSTAFIAARICDDLILNGYSDWFLPSKDELNLMYEQKNVIGGFSLSDYWSSSDIDNNDAWAQIFADGTQVNSAKTSTGWVRSVRRF